MKEQEKPNILVVDNTPANLHTIKKLLERLDVNIMTADSGNKALTLLLGYSFKLILLDVDMPIMDGYETAHLIQENEDFKHIPIVFLTAMDEGVKNKIHHYSIKVDYLFKPIDVDQLINKVKTLVLT